MATSKLFDDLPEPDYDHLAAAAGDDDDDCCKNGGKDKDKQQPAAEYILGTLVVRVVAARGLGGSTSSSSLMRSPSKHMRGSHKNPYASVKFGAQTQRTSAVFGSNEPLWPRAEVMYLDVALPSPTYGSEADETDEIPTPIVHCALFHASDDDYGTTNSQKYNPAKKGKTLGDSNDPFLGTASMDVTPILTGKKVTLDRWLPLTGSSSGDDSRGAGTVRVVCEYEAADAAPRVGDIVRFSRYCKEADLYPVPITLSYKVQELAGGDEIVLEYETPEGWICTFMAHRLMVHVTEERQERLLEKCQGELFSLSDRISYSPMVRELQQSVSRVPDDGLLDVGVGAVQGASALIFDRWFKGGVDTVIGDVQYATNWDGRFNEQQEVDEEEDDSSNVAAPVASMPPPPNNNRVPPLSLTEEIQIIPGMPCCPITGEPMVHPVVAADGHTYERTAIARWLETADKSPLTGSVLPHKDLVPNYVLLSSLREAATAVEESKMPAESELNEEESHDEEEDRKMPALDNEDQKMPAT